MTAKEIIYDKYFDTADTPIGIITKRKILEAMEEYAESVRVRRTLSAVPSELLSKKCQLIIDETASPKQFKDDKTGVDSYSRAVYELMIARDCFEEYEEQRGIAG